MDGRTDGQKIGRLYRTLLQAGAIKIVGHFEEKLGLSREKVQNVKNIGFFMKIQAFHKFYEQNKGFIGLTQNYRLL